MDEVDRCIAQAKPVDQLLVAADDGNSIAGLDDVGEERFGQVAAGDDRQPLPLKPRQQCEDPAVADAQNGIVVNRAQPRLAIQLDHVIDVRGGDVAVGAVGRYPSETSLHLLQG